MGVAVASLAALSYPLTPVAAHGLAPSQPVATTAAARPEAQPMAVSQGRSRRVHERESQDRESCYQQFDRDDLEAARPETGR